MVPDASSESSQLPAVPSLQRSDTHSRVPTIPDHTLLRCIGRGSYGEVWLARNVMGTFRAVKIVHRRDFSEAYPFEREYKGIQRYEPVSRSHHGIIDILQIGRNDEARYFYYVMELADQDRENLESEIPRDKPQNSAISTANVLRNSDLYTPHTLRSELKRRGLLPAAECIQIARLLSSGLDHLHKNGLVHRDIKPSNIIFVNASPRLADIGLVAEIDEARSFVGTVGFIAPEGPGAPQADVYSLGKVLYEMDTGKDRQEFPALPEEFQTDDFQRRELNQIILRACESDRRLRYPSAQTMHEDLVRVGQGLRVRAVRPRRPLAIIACVAFLILSAFAAARFRQQRYTPKPQAVRLLDLARFYYNQLTGEAHQKAISNLNLAVQIDPRFVPAYRLLFEINTWGLDGGENKQSICRDLATKLMVLDPKLADAHMALSWVKYGDGDWRGAEEQIRQALKIDPNYPNAHGIYGYYLALLGRSDESKEQLRRAQELDPTSRIFAMVASYPFITARQYDRADLQLRRALEVDKNFPAAYLFLGRVYEAQSKFLAAIEAFKSYDLMAGRHPTETAVRYQAMHEAYSREGARGYWLKLLEFIQADDALQKDEKIFFPADRWPLAGIYAQLGDREKALTQLENDFREKGRDDWLKFEPLYDSLHDEPRFKTLLKKAGLER